MKRNFVLIISLLLINISGGSFFAQCMDMYEENPWQLVEGMDHTVAWDASIYTGNSELVSLQTGLFEVYLDSEIFYESETYAQGLRFLVSVPNEFSILLAPEAPIPVPDFVDGFEFWMQGNNANNRIYLLLLDETDQTIEKVFGIVDNFTGWRCNTMRVKPEKNLSFIGYIIEPNPLNLDRYPQFVYFSQLAVSTGEAAE